MPAMGNWHRSGDPSPGMVVMLRTVLSSALACLVSFSLFAVVTPTNTQIMPESQVKAGMHGVAYTVFEGVKPEAIDVEILGILRNMAGPKSDVILARLHGSKVEYTGVVAGMSGSPVYIDGKLVGAIAYRIGEFSKEPIAGITPAASMMEINEMDKTPAPDLDAVKTSPKTEASRTAGPGASPLINDGVSEYTNLLKPIETPLVFSGFTEQTMQMFGKQFASVGVVPVMGAGAVSTDKQPEPLEPGSAVSAVLVRGDMNIAGTCTVTYVDATHLLACGHPLLQSGNVDMPMTKATVLATLASPYNSFKIVNTTESVGSFVQDRRTGILGRFDREPQMIPVTLNLRAASSTKQYHYEVLNNPKITPTAMMATVFNALQGMNEYGEDTTFRLNGDILVQGYPKLSVQNMYAPSDGASTDGLRHCALDRRPLQPNLREPVRHAEDSRRRVELRHGFGAALGTAGECPHRCYRSAPRRHHHDRDTASALPRRGPGAADSADDSTFDAEGYIAHSGQRRRNARPAAPRSSYR